ncbi:hypothetical protein [Hymenobacter sp. GOD-10R]|uniref:hypothetical protein n=1 Tax=Hymenobacter sp. GOD-10R TaxID=3093922 RepID=UPI002D7759E7|nr:hypothetical protein [Hymenobacter sp. GOD-10R]WRQ30792.1 hypothetical protein SD425_11015 [Hymenobacter sp. GOD-10R]
MSIIMNQVLSEVFAANESLFIAPNDTITTATPVAHSLNSFPYAEAVLAGLHRADLLDNLATESPSEAQIGQFTRWLRRRGSLTSNR